MSVQDNDMRISVYHHMNPVNGGHTEFSGPEVDYRVEGDGALRVIKWVTHTQTGDALFAPGQWSYVCRSKPLDA